MDWYFGPLLIVLFTIILLALIILMDKHDANDKNESIDTETNVNDSERTDLDLHL